MLYEIPVAEQEARWTRESVQYFAEVLHSPSIPVAVRTVALRSPRGHLRLPIAAGAASPRAYRDMHHAWLMNKCTCT